MYAAIWLCLGSHDHNHPADLGGLLLHGAGGFPVCCYVDVKSTQAIRPGAQRFKLEQRTRELKFGLMSLTLTQVAGRRFAAYPGYGHAGLMALVLLNPVVQGRRHSVYAVNWFFGIASNYQASSAKWVWGGPLGVRLPAELVAKLVERRVTLGGVETTWLDLLREFGDYHQYRDANGVWDRERLAATLAAMHFAGRYLLVHESLTEQLQSTVEALSERDAEVRLDPQEFHPGESLATYYARQCDRANQNYREALRQRDDEKRRADNEKRRADDEKRRADDEKKQAEDEKRRADETQRRAEDEKRRADETQRRAEERERRQVARARLHGVPDSEIAADLGVTLEEFQQRYPPAA